MDEMLGLDHPRQKLNRLIGYLDHDPKNLNLLADASAAAIDANEPDTALKLLDQYEDLAELPPALLNLKGLATLQQGRFEDAVIILRHLPATDPSLRFNLACAESMTGNDAGAVELLDTATALTVPGAARLKVEALHRLGELELALDEGTQLAEALSHDVHLAGALSLVALDLEMPELARGWAEKSQGTAEGLSAMGVLVLQENRIGEALALFDQGLSIRPDSARNLLGKGLALMASGDASGATRYIEQSAEIFSDHLGTWIAAGWAHFAGGDVARAREVFERALALDDTFAETHGALAVLDIFDGKPASARQRVETALRLDRTCLAGALARTLLLEQAGETQSAQRICDIALNTPLASGRTIAQLMIDIAPTLRHGVKR